MMQQFSSGWGVPLLVFGKGMRFVDDFQNIMRTLLALDESLVKILSEDTISSY